MTIFWITRQRCGIDFLVGGANEPKRRVNVKVMSIVVDIIDDEGKLLPTPPLHMVLVVVR